MRTTRVVCALALAGSLVGATAAQAAATLAGASPLRVLQKVDYQAHGLTPVGSYSLRIRRDVTHNGRTYRCAAYLSAPRRASGTEHFRGSVPSGLTCLPTRGDVVRWEPRTLKGTYQAVVCVAADRNLCKPGFSVATKTVRVS
jgi:hypothetical protein